MKGEGEGGSVEWGVLQLPQDTGPQKHGRALQVNGAAWPILPMQLKTEGKEKCESLVCCVYSRAFQLTSFKENVTTHLTHSIADDSNFKISRENNYEK